MKQLYFENSDSNICYPLDYIKDRMREDGVTEKTVWTAVPEKFRSYAWCKDAFDIIDINDNLCGKDCKSYSPRNGKSGCCKHYTRTMYEMGETKTIKL